MQPDTFEQQQQEGEGWHMQMKQKGKTDLGKAEEEGVVADAM